MNSIEFAADSAIRARMIKEMLAGNKKYRKSITISRILKVVSVCIIGGMGIVLYIHSPQKNIAMTYFVFMMVALVIASVPFFISLSIKNTAFFKNALPYSKRAGEILTITDEYIKYKFASVDKHDAAAYGKRWEDIEEDYISCIKIDISKINEIKVKNSVCNITGEIDFVPSKIDKEYLNKKEQKLKSYKILLDFPDNEKIITQLMDLK